MLLTHTNGQTSNTTTTATNLLNPTPTLSPNYISTTSTPVAVMPSAATTPNPSPLQLNHLSHLTPALPYHASYKDTRWLTLEVCREFQRNKCNRTETECKFAHPPAHVEVTNGKVIACYDSLKVCCCFINKK